MKLKSLVYKNVLCTAAYLILCVAILFSLFAPAVNMIQAQPKNPLENEAVREITILKVGDEVSNLEDIVVPNQDSAAPAESQSEESQPEETQPEESEPEESQPEESEPEESQPEETQPEESEPEETQPEESQPEESTDSEGSDDDEGNDNADEGEEGGDKLELKLATVMTWYKYGTEPGTIVCGPSSTVAQSINVAQLENSTLKYEFALSGTDSKYVDITGVSVAAGDGAFQDISESGSVELELPDGTGERDYTFRVTALIEKPDDNGETIQQELSFTFVLKCGYSQDLDLELTWRPREGNVRKIVCGPEKTESFSVKNYELLERVFGYSVQLTGSLAEDAQIISASYTTASGQKSGDLAVDSGTLILDPATGFDEETYHITFTVQTAAGETILYHIKITYQETLDVQLAFHWMEKGTIRRTKVCEPKDSVTLGIKNNQLSAGALPYEMELTGEDGELGRILSVAYTSEAGGSGNLEPSGSLPLHMAEGASANTYHITVSAMVNGQRMNFEIILHYTSDVSLQMEYTVNEEATSVTRQIICENGKSKTAEEIYDDQLPDGTLPYAMSLIGSEGENVTITSVTCFQSGSGRMVSLSPEDAVVLLLKEGKTGENTFEITATDEGGSTYHFTINIPYKHRGESNIKIALNLTDGQEIINETKTNLTVRAWSEDKDGKVLSYIPANGTDTKLIVKLDGEVLRYVSSSGAASEYTLYPANPEVGDTNTHTLYVYAEDALGNFGEQTLTLKGQRREAGQVAGKATIYVDMTVLGLGVVANLSYDVLSDEPISYVIAKAIMGMDMEEPFGSATETLGWSGRYAGTLDNGFYLQSLTTGHNANALEGGTWPGANEKEVLQAIDDRFGTGTGLATLWRCLYRNGLNKSTGSGNSFGEFDYTSGSGWMYSVGGSTYYPGQSMDGVYLQDGDVLTLRYTLAYGWDVGGGSPGYGSTVGYCVSAVNGSISVNHWMEIVENEDGSLSNVCHCCGIVQDCAHENMIFMDLEDGTHIQFCEDCQKEIGDPAEHGWVCTDENADTHHSCEECGAAQEHNWKEVEGSNTATCTEPGIRSVQCLICNQIRTEETGPTGHIMDNKWQVTAQGHYEKCSVCEEIANQGAHQYVPSTYTENGVAKTDYECQTCHAFHGDECGGSLAEVGATCLRITYYCEGCGVTVAEEGVFEEHHNYVDGSCEFCGTSNGTGPTDPEPTDPEPTDPEPTDPEPTDPEPTDPEPTDPEPTDPEPADPEPTDPEPTDPEPADPEPTDPEPTDP